MAPRILTTGFVLAATLACTAGRARAQSFSSPTLRDPHVGGSRNLTVLSHVPLGEYGSTADIEMEQELSRPYVYVARRLIPSGVDAISIRDPGKAQVIWSWRIENADLHRGAGSVDNKYFKSRGRYYDVQALQFQAGGPDPDLGAVVFDVTGLPDPARVREVARIRAADTPGGFHNIFAYKHSDGRALLFATVQAARANIYDLDKVLAGDAGNGLVGAVPVPDETARRGYHDFYLAYDAATHRDLFYGAGAGGYFVYDVSDIANPRLVVSLTGIAGVTGGHTFTPDPTGRYAVSETEYQYTPLRIFDLKPGLDGTVKNISRPIGAWEKSWDGNAHNHEVRWPYVFVSAYNDGLQVFNMMDPANPYTVGEYYTCQCILPAGPEGQGQVGGMDGAWGVDIRNADGVIVLSDQNSGFWAFKMEGFDGWNGHQWGLPNVSSAQDWDRGPEGAPRPPRVS